MYFVFDIPGYEKLKPINHHHHSLSSSFPGFVVNGLIIGKKKHVPNSNNNNNTYFGQFGIIHQKLGVRLEVSTQEISVFHNGKQVKLLWSDTASLKDTK